MTGLRERNKAKRRAAILDAAVATNASSSRIAMLLNRCSKNAPRASSS